ARLEPVTSPAPTPPTAPSAPTPRRRRWGLGALLAPAGRFVLGGAWLLGRLPAGEQLARQAECGFGRRFSIGLQIGSVQWHWRPAPQLVLRDLRTRQDAPITVEQIVATPRLQSLWQRQIGLDQ